MVLENALKDEIVSRCCAAIESNKELLTELDRAIGDGDHGINMSRGFEALRKAYDANRDQDFPELCLALGMALVMNVGGASGPLYGSLIIEMGKESTRFPRDQNEVWELLSAGIKAVKKRGKSDIGAKTMLDVLVPVCEILTKESLTVGEVRECAERSLGETKNMIATRGRSAFLGKRSLGHADPGAQSSGLLIQAICDAVEHCDE